MTELISLINYHIKEYAIEMISLINYHIKEYVTDLISLINYQMQAYLIEFNNRIVIRKETWSYADSVGPD